ncbi:MAG: NIPSNAP family protein [Bacteroidota bacterium]|nr:NIPSNAP family protein [Bacteroidota bacterium]MDP4212111.1 NIPSNAP family protein [Bacteroidota bacterium]MDP4249495.1 NIPSNAP family protein [Bacteroidota bacterium]
MLKFISKPLAFLLTNIICLSAIAQKDIYEIQTYLLKSDRQIEATDQYLKNAYLPALHRLGIKHIGVFKPIANDTASLKKIFVLVTYPSLENWRKTKLVLQQDKQYAEAARPFTDADTSMIPFVRMESTLLDAFPKHTKLTPPAMDVNSETVYELRSYENPTEHLHFKKVSMFNQGGETGIFSRLGFNAVFYAEVLSGSHLPNLMYMIVFKNAGAHDELWKAFRDDPEWKKLSADPNYENPISVSHIDSILMHRTDYSDL